MVGTGHCGMAVAEQTNSMNDTDNLRTHAECPSASPPWASHNLLELAFEPSSLPFQACGMWLKVYDSTF
jgi:hypothetical protein